MRHISDKDFLSDLSKISFFHKNKDLSRVYASHMSSLVIQGVRENFFDSIENRSAGSGLIRNLKMAANPTPTAPPYGAPASVPVSTPTQPVQQAPNIPPASDQNGPYAREDPDKYPGFKKFSKPFAQGIKRAYETVKKSGFSKGENVGYFDQAFSPNIKNAFDYYSKMDDAGAGALGEFTYLFFSAKMCYKEKDENVNLKEKWNDYVTSAQKTYSQSRQYEYLIERIMAAASKFCVATDGEIESLLKISSHNTENAKALGKILMEPIAELFSKYPFGPFSAFVSDHRANFAYCFPYFIDFKKALFDLSGKKCGITAKSKDKIRVFSNDLRFDLQKGNNDNKPVGENIGTTPAVSSDGQNSGIKAILPGDQQLNQEENNLENQGTNPESSKDLSQFSRYFEVPDAEDCGKIKKFFDDFKDNGENLIIILSMCEEIMQRAFSQSKEKDVEGKMNYENAKNVIVAELGLNNETYGNNYTKLFLATILLEGLYEGGNFLH